EFRMSKSSNLVLYSALALTVAMGGWVVLHMSTQHSDVHAAGEIPVISAEGSESFKAVKRVEAVEEPIEVVAVSDAVTEPSSTGFNQKNYAELSKAGMNWKETYAGKPELETVATPNITSTSGTAESTVMVVAATTEVTATTPTTIPEAAPEGDVTKGEKVFKKCRSCHTANEGGKKKTGPNLWGVYGSDIGSKGGYKYSKAMTNFEGVWDDESLDSFLTKPKKYIKKTKMNFAGLRKEKDRVNMIAYLKSLQ
ncbi:MAG: c-type cytochrome, partial [Alphaproteobacteria bacterium]